MLRIAARVLIKPETSNPSRHGDILDIGKYNSLDATGSCTFFHQLPQSELLYMYNNDRYKFLVMFDFGLDRTSHFRLTCPCSEKILIDL